MDPGNISAVISACAGIGGVILGNSFLTIKEAWFTRSKRKRDAEYLAILVVSHLDRYASGCLNVALDDGTEEGRPAGNDGSYWATTTKPPAFAPLDIAVDWKSLPRDLMYAILRLPDRQQDLHHHLAGVHHFDDQPEYIEYFWARRRGYAEFGLEVSAVARKLRRHTGMPVEEHVPGEWTRDSELKEIIEKVDQERAFREARIAEYRAKGSPAFVPPPLTPPTPSSQ